MPSPINDDRFHPEDPTKWLWKKLLRNKPLPHDRRSLNKKGRRDLGVKLQQYYVDHQHPRTRKATEGDDDQSE